MRYQNVLIEALGYELPSRVVTSEDLEDRLEPLYRALRFQKGQLEVITGVQERRFWKPGFQMKDGAVAAGRKALEETRVSSDRIGMLIFGGVCRDHVEPATACAVAHELQLGPETQIYDVSNACLGVLNGMVQAANAIELGQIEAGLVVSCESSREIIDNTIDRLLAHHDMNLFRKTVATLTGGSGAVAVLLVHKSLSSSGHRLLGATARNASQHHGLCLWSPMTEIAPRGEMALETDSAAVLQNGVILGKETFDAFRKNLGWNENLPDKIICHQVGATHQRSILKALDIPVEKDFTTFAYLGNIGTVSLPITAAIADQREFLLPGDRVGFLGIGSGLNCLMLGIEW